MLTQALRDFSPVAFASSMGAEDMVLTDLIAQHQLDIEMSLTVGAFGGFARRRKNLGQVVVEVCFIFVVFADFHHELAKVVLRESLEFGFEAIDFAHNGAEFANFLVAGIAHKAGKK